MEEKTTEKPGPLSGVRVLDLSRLLPGPFATLLLADLGAEVIKIEDPQVGDYARYYPPLVDGVGALYASINRNKRSLALDLKSSRGRSVVRQMLGQVDVLVESYRPGVLARLGLAPQELRESFPELIICSISGFGQTGPARERAGHDLNFLARAGLLGQNAAAGQSPVVPGFQLADLAGGALYAALGITAALYGRERGKEGAWLDISMTEGALSLVAPLVAMQAAGDPVRPGAGLLSGGLPCYRLYPTADGRHLAVAALEPKFWEALVAALHLEHLSGKGMLGGEAGEEVARELGDLLASESLNHWERLLARVDCCVEPVRDVGELIGDAMHQAREVFFMLAGVQQTRTPLSAQTLARDATPAPRRGEHSEAVLQDFGWSTESIDDLRRQGVIG
ncbi:CoA transferase [Lujinxingia litoralis]|uniref:CoA transferase n=1 Tax=Lujinxingia litoralis TaxID=2211119 RepID=A0A328C8Y0_9DELT|nr:CaiB/BaiF CoA-transferase family protein [Lujinxingia litoralis]RAL21836.1 CoA transferase [Lujinxingia litoralis]